MSLPQQLPLRLYVLAGLTGSGKSELIRFFRDNNTQALDLETLCGHDGSVFASLRFGRQPTSYQFHKQLQKHWNRFDPGRPVFLESELKRIGNLNLPDWLVNTMATADVIWLDVDRGLRRERLAGIMATAAPGRFLDCLQKLAYKLGPERQDRAIRFFNAGDFGATADILMAYYDATPGYALSTERIKLRFPIDRWNTPEIAEQILRAVDGLS
ncbi:hypothetical protein ACFPMF_22935 [Larkinella bovis]|uniref:tRNA 2-selenouridine synthase AAA domain-containing protein n=1 Tax=Larkinella bovis TaxID=683041 RepID=A0ABW0IFE3_9BACT